MHFVLWSFERRTLSIATVFLSIVFAVPTPAPVLVPVSPPSHPAPSSFIKTIETRPARPVPGPHTLIFIKILLRPWAHSHRQIARQCQQLGREYNGENVTNLMHDGCSILMNINNKRIWKIKLCFCNWNAQKNVSPSLLCIQYLFHFDCKVRTKLSKILSHFSERNPLNKLHKVPN